MNNLLVFGLDGASFEVLNAYVKENPGGFFDYILSNGFASTLQSTIPFFTAPAWTTFMTGLNPGEHGVYHWLGRFDSRLGKRPLISSAHLAEATFWYYCQQHGKRVSVTNFPMQYPAPPTDGRYICGTLAPETASHVTWPPKLIEQVRKEIPGYRFEMDKGISYLNRPFELRDHILKLGSMHSSALESFGAVASVDLLVHVVTITDRMQHFFWNCFDPTHPEYSASLISQIGNPIFEAYRLAETSLEKLWNQRHWDNLIVLSDHGMGPSTISFRTDVWLEEKGYTKFLPNGEVDVTASVAYSGGEPECAIYINKKSRDGFGASDDDYLSIIENLKEDLLQLRLNDGPVFEKIYLQSELFNGLAKDWGPDLILVPSNGIHPQPGSGQAVFDKSTRLYAGHRYDGIFVGYGKAFQKCHPLLKTLHIQDMFPLMCMLMNLAIPHGLWGAIPQEFLNCSPYPPKFDNNINWNKQVSSLPIHQQESQEMRTRLAELGYE